jgi:hypothetical protein
MESTSLVPMPAYVEAAKRMRDTVEQDLRFRDVVATVGRFDCAESSAYMLYPHAPAGAQLVCLARRYAYHFVTVARVNFADAARTVPRELEVIEITAPSVQIRTAPIMQFKDGPEMILVGGFGEPKIIEKAPHPFEGVRALLHRYVPKT